MDKEVKKSLSMMLGFVAAWLIGSIMFSLLGLFNRPDAPPTFFGLFLAGPILIFFDGICF